MSNPFAHLKSAADSPLQVLSASTCMSLTRLAPGTGRVSDAHSDDYSKKVTIVEREYRQECHIYDSNSQELITFACIGSLTGGFPQINPDATMVFYYDTLYDTKGGNVIFHIRGINPLLRVFIDWSKYLIFIVGHSIGAINVFFGKPPVRIRYIDIQTKKEHVVKCTLPSPSPLGSYLQMPPSCSLLLACHEYGTDLVDPISGMALSRLSQNASQGKFSLDEKSLFLGGQIWSTEHGRHVYSLADCHDLCTTMDNSLLISADNDGNISLRDAQTGATLRRIEIDHTRYAGGRTALQELFMKTWVDISRDGRKLVIGHSQGSDIWVVR
jgi:hypothetical protein